MNDLISRAEAKEALRERFKRIPTYAIWAMHIIDELPTHTASSNTLGALDCVERQQAINIIKDLPKWELLRFHDDDFLNYRDVMSVLKDKEGLPSVWLTPCEFCKHNNIADDKACLMCSAERRTDE